MSFFKADETNVPFTNPDEVKIEDLVGEDKKYKDADAIAKALAHSQNHIQSLEAGMNELRTDLTTRVTVEDALKQLSSKSEAAPKEPVTPTGEPAAPKEEVKALSPEDIQKTIEETLKAREAEGTRSANLAETQTTLKRIYGDGADRFVQEKAAALGLTVDQLVNQAQVSPTAFYKLLDVDTKAKPDNQVKPQTYTRANVNRTPDASALETMEDFKALRKENPTKFWNPKTQQKLLQMKLAQLEN